MPPPYRLPLGFMCPIGLMPVTVQLPPDRRGGSPSHVSHLSLAISLHIHPGNFRSFHRGQMRILSHEMGLLFPGWFHYVSYPLRPILSLLHLYCVSAGLDGIHRFTSKDWMTGELQR